MQEVDVANAQPDGQTLWFRAGKYKVKKPPPRQVCAYIFDSDNSDRSDIEEDHKDDGDTLLLYELPQEDSCEPLLPSFVARKIPLPLELSTNVHTIFLDPPLGTSESRETLKGVASNDLSDSPTLMGGAAPQFTVPDADPKIVFGEDRRLLSSQKKRTHKHWNHIKKVPIWVLSLSSSFSSISVIIPLTIMLLGVSCSLVLLFFDTIDAESFRSRFLFFILGECFPDIVILYCIIKNKPWHSFIALQLTFALLGAEVIWFPIHNLLIAYYIVLKVSLAFFLLTDRKRVCVTKTTFYLHRDIRKKERRSQKLQKSC